MRLHWGDAHLVAWRRVGVPCVVHESCLRWLMGKPTGKRLPGDGHTAIVAQATNVHTTLTPRRRLWLTLFVRRLSVVEASSIRRIAPGFDVGNCQATVALACVPVAFGCVLGFGR
jgi:hypothetical protein